MCGEIQPSLRKKSGAHHRCWPTRGGGVNTHRLRYYTKQATSTVTQVTGANVWWWWVMMEVPTGRNRVAKHVTQQMFLEPARFAFSQSCIVGRFVCRSFSAASDPNQSGFSATKHINSQVSLVSPCILRTKHDWRCSQSSNQGQKNNRSLARNQN